MPFFRRVNRVAGDRAETLLREQFFPCFRRRHAACSAFTDERTVRENGVPELSGVGKLRVDMPVAVQRRGFQKFTGSVEVADQIRDDDDERGGISGFSTEFIPPRAPDAEHLDSGVADERELPFEYSRILVVETVGRHPVASFYKELFPVDAESPVTDCVVAAVLRTGKINFFVFPLDYSGRECII